MGYSVSDSIVRMDIFKRSGKWAESVAVDMASAYQDEDIHTAVLNCYMAQDGRYKGCTLVCLKPYHKFSHPIMVTIPE